MLTDEIEELKELFLCAGHLLCEMGTTLNSKQ